MASFFARFLRAVVRRFWISAGSAGMTFSLFLVLPLMQTIVEPPAADLIVQEVDTAALPPPPPPVEEEPPDEPEPEPEPPHIPDDAPPLDLSQLELALNPGMGDGWGMADFALKLDTFTGKSAASVDDLFSVAELDQPARPIYEANPILTTKLRRRGPATVWLIFIVDERGKVQQPRVQSSPDPIFEKPALKAIQQWKFEPGRRGGKSVSSRMRLPMTFPGL